MQIVDSGVTAAAGYTANGIAAGVKKEGLDLAAVVSDRPATAAGVFTKNRLCSPSVTYDREVVARGTARAVIINSGNANACTGEQGFADVRTVAAKLAETLDVSADDVLVSSTGVIGVRLPVVTLCDAVPELVDGLSAQNGAKAAEAIMTTDTVPKELAVQLDIAGTSVTVGGMAKGSGMIAPNMATMLAFITTDAAVEAESLRNALRDAANKTFNCVSVDGDSSTNDSVIVLANGAAGGPILHANTPEFDLFREALDRVCRGLALMLVRDGEGAAKVMEVRVIGAKDDSDAALVARTVGESMLVKTALAGGDANWGRIACAVGYSGAEIDPDRLGIRIGEVHVMRDGMAVEYEETDATAVFATPEMSLQIDLGTGSGQARFWSCDLTHEYVTINASYRT